MPEVNENWARARRMFEEETKEHEMTVLHDDGLYRHLRFAKPGTGMWHWELVTWPGSLAIRGDVGDGYMFTRVLDMFEFFHPIGEPWRVNAGYWWEKMPSPLRDSAKKYSAEKFKQLVREHASDWRDELADDERAEFDAQLDADVLSWADEEHAARPALDEFEFNGRSFTDTWDWGDFRDWDFHFLIALFAIVYGVEKYKASK